MSFSRRRFLKAGTIVTVAAGIPMGLARFVAGQQPSSDMSGGGTLAVSGDFQPDALSYLRQSSFEPYVNSIFVLQGSRSDAAANVVLQSVIDLITRPKIKLSRTGRVVAPETNGRECFVLKLRNDDGVQLDQDVYGVQHAALGEFRLLITRSYSVPGGSTYYEALINRS